MNTNVTITLKVFQDHILLFSKIANWLIPPQEGSRIRYIDASGTYHTLKVTKVDHVINSCTGHQYITINLTTPSRNKNKTPKS